MAEKDFFGYFGTRQHSEFGATRSRISYVFFQNAAAGILNFQKCYFRPTVTRAYMFLHAKYHVNIFIGYRDVIK